MAIQSKGNPFTNNDFELCGDDAVMQWASAHTWNEIEKVVSLGQSYLINGEAEAERWHEQFEVSKFYLKVMPILEEVLNKHLFEMAVAGISDTTLLIFIPSVCDDRYTSRYGNLNVFYTVFIRTVDGRVLKTNVFDETYFGNENSEAADKVASNPLLFETEEGVYCRNNKEEAFSLLDGDKRFEYSVISKDCYRKRSKMGGQSELLIRNPLNNNFEIFPFGDEVEDCYGQHFVSCLVKGEEEWVRHIYKRNLKTGQFEKDGEMPYSYCVRICQTKDELTLEFMGSQPHSCYTYKGKLGV